MGCLAQNGYSVTGVDILPDKVDLINQGIPTIVEKDIDKIIAEQHRAGRISATTDYIRAVQETEISIICVGTPSTPEGHLDLSHIFNTVKQIGEALKQKNEFHIVVIRSTVLPGTNKKAGEIIVGLSDKRNNTDFAVVSNPEFLREGTAVKDYYNPALTVIGSDNPHALNIVESLYDKINAPIVRVEIDVAEIIKYANNSFHALKVTFANEIGNICKKMGIDSHEVMRIFSMDKKLNLSSYYLKPGFAYGGSCLPKDLKALGTMAHDLYLDTPVLNSIQKSNEIQKENAFLMIEKTGKKKIGILGLSFKPGTDDLRFSPIVDVIEKLYGKGYNIKIYDRNVVLSKLTGKNKSYIENKLPHLSQMLSDNLAEVTAWAEVLVIANKEEEFSNISIKNEQVIIDLARIDTLRAYNNYEGICW